MLVPQREDEQRWDVVSPRPRLRRLCSTMRISVDWLWRHLFIFIYLLIHHIMH